MLRISDGWIRRFIWFAIVTMNAVGGFNAMATYIQCTPAEKLWNPLMQGGSCWPKQVIITLNVFASCAYRPMSPHPNSLESNYTRRQHTRAQWTSSWRCCRGASS